MPLGVRAAEQKLGGPYGQYGLVALLVEAMIYGVYFPLFVSAFNIMRTRDGLRTASSRFQIAGLTLMFFLITLNAAMVLYTMIALYVVPPAPPVIPKPGVPPVRTPMPWDVYVSLVILIMVGWIADIIMIYRVFLVYSRSYRVIILPCAVMIVSFSAGFFNFWYALNPNKFPRDKAQIWRGLFFPMTMINSILTTALIAHRIWVQHRRMQAAGIRAALAGRSGVTSLVLVLRIIIESAMIFTALMIIVGVMFYTEYEPQIIFKQAIVPSAGIVFALIAIRTQNARETQTSTWPGDQPTSFALPGWMMDDSTPSRHVDADRVSNESRDDQERSHSVAKPHILPT